MSLRKQIESLELKNFSFSYAENTPVFEDVNFIFPDSHAIWLRTAGGRGRSTLLKVLAGLLSPQKGQYLVNGKDVAEMAFADFLKLRLNMGYGFDMHGLLNNKSIFENLIFPLEYHQLVPRVEAAARVQDMIDRFGLSASQDLRPFAVTGSERKLTCVLRALIHHPQIVFLDDPFVGLKMHAIETLSDYIKEAFKKHGLKQVIFTSESAEWAERFHAAQVLVGHKHLELKRAA